MGWEISSGGTSAAASQEKNVPNSHPGWCRSAFRSQPLPWFLPEPVWRCKQDLKASPPRGLPPEPGRRRRYPSQRKDAAWRDAVPRSPANSAQKTSINPTKAGFGIWGLTKKNMDSPILFQARADARAGRSPRGALGVRCPPVPGHCSLPRSVARLRCRQMGREEAPSGASASASRPWDAAVAAGTQGQARLLLTLAATQGNAAGSPARPTPMCRHREFGPGFTPLSLPSRESPPFLCRSAAGERGHGCPWPRHVGGATLWGCLRERDARAPRSGRSAIHRGWRDVSFQPPHPTPGSAG